jgi:hypothetical protein
MRSIRESALRSQRPEDNPILPEPASADARFVSVKTLARQWDCSRTTVCRLLEEAGVPAFFLGKGRNGAKRYREADVEAFLRSVEHS